MATIRKGDFIIENPDSVKGSKDDGKEPGKDSEGHVEIDGQHKLVNPEKIADQKDKKNPYRRTLDKAIPKSSKQYKSKKDLGKAGDPKKITAKWSSALSSALSSGGGLNDKARKLLKQITSNRPKVNWRREFAKWMDSALRQYEYRLPNKRTLASGTITYGKYRAGQGTLNTLVLAVDTSGSITKDMVSVFYEETWRLATLYDIDRTIIIYVSDSVDNVDIIKKGKKPDLTKWASTGGNSGGFDHPFKWLKDKKIIPSAFIYFTDTGASYPSVNNYGIKKYVDKIWWFICNGSSYNKPPFGKSIVVNMDSKGKFS